MKPTVHNHSVQFYQDDMFLIGNVSSFVKDGLTAQETVIVVATAPHRDELRKQLFADNVIGLSAPEDGHYVALDAEETLSLFMINGWPDEHLFLSGIGQLLRDAAKGRPMRIFGEMVAVLWAQGNHRAALRLEDLWNELAKQHSFALLCAYPSHAFQGADMAASFKEVCASHSHVLTSSVQG